MKDSIKVARWEIKKNITNKMFLIMTFVFPIFILAIGGIAGYFGSQSSDSAISIGVIDQTEIFYSEFKNNLEETGSEVMKLSIKDQDEIKSIIEEKELDGVLLIPEDIINNNQAYFYTEDLMNVQKEYLMFALNPLVVNYRLEQEGLPTAKIHNLTRDLNLVPRTLDKEDGFFNMIVPMALAMFMVLASIFSGSALMQGIIKEKNNKVVESLFSSITAKDLMYGKIIGYGILGLGQIIIWAGAGLLAGVKFFDFNIDSILNVKTVYMLVYFVLGFILVAALNAIAGASTRGSEGGSNTSMSNYIAIIPVVPLWLLSIIISNPEGLITKIMTYIPFFTPTTMLLRMGISAPGTGVIYLTLAILLVFDYILIRLAGKIFRIGMLMYGKKVSFGEIIKWSRM